MSAAPVAGAAAVLVGLPIACVVGLSTIAMGATSGGAISMGSAVPAQYVPSILAAAETCPRLTPGLLAAQLAAESNFDPNAVSPAGAQGIAQFMPGTWATIGGDYDADGANSPFDPEDAIEAQAKYMCSLIDDVTASGLADTDTEVIKLALAAYNAGLGAVTAAHGIPPYPETINYVAQITTKAADPAYGLILNTNWDGTNPDSALPTGYANTRTAEAAVAYGLAQVGVFRDAGYCLRFVSGAYGPPPSGKGIDYAHQVWDNSPNELHHPRDFKPPRGAIVLWDSGIGGGAGHIAISLGDGTMITTTRGAVAIQHIAGFADSHYLGWMPAYFTHGR